MKTDFLIQARSFVNTYDANLYCKSIVNTYDAGNFPFVQANIYCSDVKKIATAQKIEQACIKYL